MSIGPTDMTKRVRVVKVCNRPSCGLMFEGKTTQKYCSVECQKKDAYRRNALHPNNHSRIEKARIKYRYNTTPEQVEAMRVMQGGTCAICGRAGRLVIDHNHSTGQVRGLLCFECNTMLGYARDDVTTLAAAIVYLREH